jgi:hypothetical protein
MKRTALIFSLLIFASCAKQNSVTATIRVTLGNPPQAEIADGYSLNSEAEIFTSHEFTRHVDEKFNLSKLWNLSESQTATKLGNAITVNGGNEPGLFVIKINGFEHDLAVKILNELCDFYTKQQLTESRNGGQQQKINVSIVKGAE